MYFNVHLKILICFPVSAFFKFLNRTITDVCSDSSEPEWALNIKKGFISSLQSTVAPSKLGLNVTEVSNMAV